MKRRRTTAKSERVFRQLKGTTVELRPRRAMSNPQTEIVDPELLGNHQHTNKSQPRPKREKYSRRKCSQIVRRSSSEPSLRSFNAVTSLMAVTWSLLMSTSTTNECLLDMKWACTCAGVGERYCCATIGIHQKGRRTPCTADPQLAKMLAQKETMKASLIALTG